MSRPNRTGIDWSLIEEVRAYDRLRKHIERKERKHILEDRYGYRVPLWVLPRRERNAAIKLGLIKRRWVPR